MTRIEHTFKTLSEAGKKGFIAYITAGDPSLKATRDFVLRLEDEGVDVIELGIPFSDPLADGRVNQASATRALENGVTPDKVLDCISSIRERSEIPMLCYTYMNPMLAKGFNAMCRKASQAGLDGVLLLDLPIEELSPYGKQLEKHNLNNICLVTPTSPPERIRKISKASSGFVYCVSREGVTGAQKTLHSGADKLVKSIKKTTRLPVAIGFGVSSPAIARQAVKTADAVVVGSAIVNRLYTEPHTAAGRKHAARWVGTLVRAVKEV